jgi:hypothetical protein
MLIALILCLGTAAGGGEGPDRPLIFGVNRVGAAAILYDPPGYEEAMFHRIREAGGTCVRLVASPRDIEPERGRRRWGEFERDLDLAIRYGQEPIVLIVNTPAWASPTGEATHLHPYRPELAADFADFSTDLARRTKGKARLFQLWNEPNGCGWHFQDGFNHADEYLPVLKVCARALRAGNPDCVLSLGGLDDAEGHAPIFLRKLYGEIGKDPAGKGLFDAVSDHPYSDTVPVMRGKLDALREILRANGDGARPFWITEYGWHTGNVTSAEQAERVARFLEAFASPAWNDLQAAISLSIADFEGTSDGFGLTDANLRPRPAFFAFQGASRFGAFPPFEIRPAFIARGRLAIVWKTLRAAAGSVRLEPAGGGGAATAGSAAGTEHRVEFDGLADGRLYRFRIETSAIAAGGTRTWLSAEHEVRAPGEAVANGDFEGGFFAGIGEGWRIEGEGFCTDAALLGAPFPPEKRHAQAVFALGEKGHRTIDSTLSAPVAAAPGRPIEVSLSWASREVKTLAEVSARAGIDPRGGEDPSDPGIRWTEWTELGRTWKTSAVQATAGNTLVRIFIQCRLKGDLRKGAAAFLLDDVRAAPPSGIPSGATEAPHREKGAGKP